MIMPEVVVFVIPPRQFEGDGDGPDKDAGHKRADAPQQRAHGRHLISRTVPPAVSPVQPWRTEAVANPISP